MLLLLPTDTCYGLAGEFTEQDYIDIYRLKGRSFDKLLALLVEDFDDMRRYIEISDEQIEFLRDYPYPWSFLGNKKSDFVLPAWMGSEKYQMLSIRVASVCIPQGSVIARIGDRQAITDNRYPMFLTSANLS
jgi:tRNA A37 threonylcarbamoyladenosine synthetase subunit TsaC/SUA5/YrdC